MNAQNKAMGDFIRQAARRQPAQPAADAAQPAPIPRGNAGIGAYQVLPPAPPTMNDFIRAVSHNLNGQYSGVMK